MRNILFFGTIGMILFSFGCSKKNDVGKPASAGQVASITTSDGNAWYFFYDNQGRVTKILYARDTSSSTKTFKYNNQQVITSSVDQRGQTTMDTLQVNKDSSLHSDIKVVNGATTSKYTYVYSNGELDSMYFPNPEFVSAAPALLSYAWQNGDCLSYVELGILYIIGSPRPIEQYTYYENQPGQPIDAVRVGEYEMYGNAAFTIKTAHTVQSYTNLYGTINYTYIYDDQARVIGIKDSGRDSITTTITYE